MSPLLSYTTFCSKYVWECFSFLRFFSYFFCVLEILSLFFSLFYCSFFSIPKVFHSLLSILRRLLSDRKFDLSFHVDCASKYLSNHLPFQWKLQTILRPFCHIIKGSNKISLTWIGILILTKFKWFKHRLDRYQYDNTVFPNCILSLSKASSMRLLCLNVFKTFLNPSINRLVKVPDLKYTPVHWEYPSQIFRLS